MASFGQQANGTIDDRVRVRLGGGDVLKFENYNVHASVLQQPAAFSTTISARDGSAEILKKYPPGTAFELFIGPQKQFSGFLDSQSGQGTAGSTSVVLTGRDVLAKLFDNDVDADQSFTNVTFSQLVKEALKQAGLPDRNVAFDNANNLTIKSGVNVATTEDAPPTNEVVTSGTGPVVKHIVRAKLGESWLDFVRRHIAKVGLFLWADADGNFILSTPKPSQLPRFRWHRKRGKLDGRANVTNAQFHNDTTHRYSEVVIYTRKSGRKSGRGKLHGGFVDEEMVALGLNKVRVYRDVNVTSVAQAEAYARRKIAEVNRRSWNLTYTFSGHTALDVHGDRAVITPDTMAEVNDEEFGINKTLYIESVAYAAPPQRTVVTMMRPEDLIFGADE